MSYGIYKATFTDGSEETVKADGFMQAVGLVKNTWMLRSESLASMFLLRLLREDEVAEPDILDGVA